MENAVIILDRYRWSEAVFLGHRDHHLSLTSRRADEVGVNEILDFRRLSYRTSTEKNVYRIGHESSILDGCYCL